VSGAKCNGVMRAIVMTQQLFSVDKFFNSDQECGPAISLRQTTDPRERNSMITIDVSKKTEQGLVKPRTWNFTECIEYNLNLTPNFCFIFMENEEDLNLNSCWFDEQRMGFVSRSCRFFLAMKKTIDCEFTKFCVMQNIR